MYDDSQLTGWITPDTLPCVNCDGTMTKRDQRGSQALYRCETCDHPHFELNWPEEKPIPPAPQPRNPHLRAR